MPRFKEPGAGARRGAWSPLLRGTWHKHKNPAPGVPLLWVSQGVDRGPPLALPPAERGRQDLECI